jgi:hypothetical protein
MACRHCSGADAYTHTTEEHSEDWVNLADARYTGEVIFMSAMLIHDGLEALNIPNTMNEHVLAHVDRRIVQALVDAIKATDPYGDPGVGIFENYNSTALLDILQKQLTDHPTRQLPDEDQNYNEDNS